MSSDDRCNESLCEKSIKMVANIIKLSSFSISKMTLGEGRQTAAPRSLEPLADSAMADNKPEPFRISGSRRSQQPQGGSKHSFLIEPGEKNDSTYEIHEEMMSIDGRASAYIRKVHEKNRNNYNNC
jgi:hypothetical protein